MPTNEKNTAMELLIKMDFNRWILSKYIDKIAKRLFCQLSA